MQKVQELLRLSHVSTVPSKTVSFHTSDHISASKSRFQEIHLDVGGV